MDKAVFEMFLATWGELNLEPFRVKRILERMALNITDPGLSLDTERIYKEYVNRYFRWTDG